MVIGGAGEEEAMEVTTSRATRYRSRRIKVQWLLRYTLQTLPGGFTVCGMIGITMLSSHLFLLRSSCPEMSSFPISSNIQNQGYMP